MSEVLSGPLVKKRRRRTKAEVELLEAQIYDVLAEDKLFANCLICSFGAQQDSQCSSGAQHVPYRTVGDA